MNPKPIPRGERATEKQRPWKGDSPWRGKEEKINDKEEGGKQMKGEIGEKGELSPFGDHKGFVDLDLSAFIYFGEERGEDRRAQNLLRIAQNTRY